MGTKLPLFRLALFAATLAACTDDLTPPTEIPVAAVRLVPSSIELLVGRSWQLTAIATGAGGVALANRTIQWNSSDAAVATVSGSGLVTAIKPGATTITATVGGKSGTASISVRQPVSQVVIVPEDLTLQIGERRLLVATPVDAAGQPVVGPLTTWSSSSPQVVSVDQAGNVTGITGGSALIFATADGVNGSANVSVPIPPLASIEGVWDWVERVGVCSDTGSYVFTQLETTLQGSSQQVGACANGSRNDLIGTLQSGSVNGNQVGFVVRSGDWVCSYSGFTDVPTATRISGTVACGAGSGTWSAVRQTPVSSVSILPNDKQLLRGATVTFAAELRNAAGQRIFFRPALTWTSGNDAIASVAQNGQVFGAGNGTTQVTATVEGVTGSAGVTVLTLSFTALAAGGFASCGPTTTGDTWCWGDMPYRIEGGPSFASLSIGAASGCGLTADGSAWCWGDNATGALGVPGVPWTDRPMAVAGGLHFASLAAGGGFIYDYYYYYYYYTSTHTCGIALDGSAYCWGLNSVGQLGDGTQNSYQSPHAVSTPAGQQWSRLSAGARHTCGITLAGAAYCWGSNDVGQLGAGIGDAFNPRALSGGQSWKAIAAGSWHTCALTTTGSAWCWGLNGSYQLGNGTILNSPVPVAVAGGLSFTAIAAGDSHTCALTASGQAYCWGSNGEGELGAGPRVFSSTPIAVTQGGVSFTSLSSGSWAHHTCGLSDGNVAYCWGRSGSVGAPNVSSDRPVRVFGQP